MVGGSSNVVLFIKLGSVGETFPFLQHGHVLNLSFLIINVDIFKIDLSCFALLAERFKSKLTPSHSLVPKYTYSLLIIRNPNSAEQRSSVMTSEKKDCQGFSGWTCQII